MSVSKKTKNEDLYRYYCPLGLLCGRRLKSDVRPSVCSVWRFCNICLYRRPSGHQHWVHILTEENQVLILEPWSFFIHTGILYRLFSAFCKNCKKVHEWYLAVKYENANKRTRFLSVKTFKIHLFGDDNSWSTLDLTSPNITF